MKICLDFPLRWPQHNRCHFVNMICRFVSPPPPTYVNIKQLHDFVDQTKPCMGDRGEPVKFTFNADLMHKLIV